MADNKHSAPKKYADEELLQYLRQEMPGDEANALEKDMLNDAFLYEAMEGLEKYSTPGKIANDIHHINTKIRKHTSRKRKLRYKNNKQPQWILYIAFIVIILLLIAYVVMQ